MIAAFRDLHRTHGNQFVQRLLAGAIQREGEPPEGVEETIAQTRGGGHALPTGVRGHMESAFGADFSPVRLHTDATADVLSRSLSAVAFTTGNDIYFRKGEYDPDGASGRRLLAHELTHVAQQAGSTPGGSLVVGPPGDVYEQEADQMADAVMQHTPQGDSQQASAEPGPAPGAAIQRMQDDEEEESAPQ